MNKANILKTEVLSDNHYTLKRVTFELLRPNGSYEPQCREVFDRGNGTTILLYNKQKKTVILTEQFRIPTYLNGNTSGRLIEACAGVIDEGPPEDTIIRETEEETGYKITNPIKIYEAYMSPGAVTEIIHFYISEYEDAMKVSQGGGLASEHEHIDVLEMKFAEVIEMLNDGKIRDGKTIVLLQYMLLKRIMEGATGPLINEVG